MRMQLLRDPGVRFAGYKIPHPLVFDVYIRVETMDSKLAPINVFESALQDLQLEIETLEREFDVSFPVRKKIDVIKILIAHISTLGGSKRIRERSGLLGLSCPLPVVVVRYRNDDWWSNYVHVYIYIYSPIFS